MTNFSVFLTFLILTTSLFANAGAITVKTKLTCEQQDGDQWYSVGIVPSTANSGVNIVTVKNNDDDGSRERVVDAPAILTPRDTKDITYENMDSTVKLVVSRSNHGIKAVFFLLKDGPGSIQNMKMDCFVNSEIIYNVSSGLEQL